MIIKVFKYQIFKGINVKKNTKIIIGVSAVILISILWYVGTYNSLIGLDESVDGQWAQVENQYQRRADLIPNLIETVKGARDFEADTHAKIAELRTQANQIKQTLKKLEINLAK